MLQRAVHLTTRHLARPSSTLAAWREACKTKRTVERDTVELSRVRGLISTIELGKDPPAAEWEKGAPLPPGFSLLLFPPTSTATSSLRPDGTEPSGPFHPPSPPSGILERMWVSGSFEFGSAALRVGDDVVSEGCVESVVEKTGRDGRKGVYVTARRAVGRDGEEAALVERRTHLYRPPLVRLEAAAKVEPGAIQPKSKEVKPRRDQADFSSRFSTSPAMLFRFSALTFNTHRIHWDLDYCLDVERREGLIVHGPLTSLLLLSALRHNSSKVVSTFSYRATSPLAVGRDVWFCGSWKGADECELWVEDGQGRVYMTGKGSLG